MSWLIQETEEPQANENVTSLEQSSDLQMKDLNIKVFLMASCLEG